MIVIVAGLPRSGTSLMMRCLDAAGFPVVADEDKTFEAQSALNPGWEQGIDGKAIKVLDLTAHMPGPGEYLTILMERDIEQVARSQTRLMKAHGYVISPKMRQRFRGVLKNEIRDIRKAAERLGDVIRQPFGALLNGDIRCAGRLNLDVEAMRKVIWDRTTAAMPIPMDVVAYG